MPRASPPNTTSSPWAQVCAALSTAATLATTTTTSSKPQPSCAAAWRGLMLLRCHQLRVDDRQLDAAGARQRPKSRPVPGCAAGLVSEHDDAPGPWGISSSRCRCIRPIGPPPPTIRDPAGRPPSGYAMPACEAPLPYGAEVRPRPDVHNGVIVRAAHVYGHGPAQRPLAHEVDQSAARDDRRQPVEHLRRGIPGR